LLRRFSMSRQSVSFYNLDNGGIISQFSYRTATSLQDAKASLEFMKNPVKLCCLVLLWTVLPLGAQTVDDIVAHMMIRNSWQDKTLVEFRAQRKFYASNARFKTDSTMYVQTVFRQPDQLSSTVTSQEGSKLIRTHVFDKILEAETEARSKQQKAQVDIVPDNYDFSLLATEQCDDRICYHLKILPKRRDKYSLNGEIWVDAQDYSIVRVHGSPAKRPSVWTGKTEIDRQYEKIDGVWLPVHMDSSSEIMIAGHSTLSIEYRYDSVKIAQ
jgi:hypothetical protein